MHEQINSQNSKLCIESCWNGPLPISNGTNSFETGSGNIQQLQQYMAFRNYV